MDPNYFDPSFNISNVALAHNEDDCYNKCIDDVECVHFVYFKQQISEIQNASCFLKKAIDVQKGILFDSQFVKTGYLKSK